MTRIMGLDYGSKTVGVAISDELGITAQGVETMTPEQLARLKEGWQSAGADRQARVSRAVDEAAVLDSMGPAAKAPAAGTEEEATA